MASQITGYIGQINPGNGINYSIGSTVYGECNTAAATAAKIVDMTGFTLIKGATIYVKFINANTASSPTLNVQGTGAKPIISNDTLTQYWPAGTLLELTYNDENWITNNLITYNIAASDLNSSSIISTPIVSYNNNKLEYNEYVQYLRKPTIIDSSTSPAVQHYATGLKILGSLTGNNDNLNVSGQRGVFSINQPGPQIRFGYINDVESNQGALIYTNNNISSNGKNENSFGGSSFHFVADGEKPTKLVAGGYTSIDGIKSSVTLLNLQSIEGTFTSTTGNTIISTLTTDRREEAFIRYYLPAVTTTYSGGIATTSSMQNSRFVFAQRSPKSLTNTSTTASNEMSWEFYRLPITTSDLQSSQTYEILTSKIPANEEVLGGIKIGYIQTGQNYPIELDNNNQAYVNVPWTDNNTATAADNILEGSNNGTEITYSPYSTRQNKLSFYTGSTNPNGTNRLNLNGYLYATKLYSGGLEVLTSHQSLDNYKTKQIAISSSTGTAESDTATRFIYSFSQDANGVVSVQTRSLPTYNNYSLPPASSAALGGIKIGYTESEKNYAVKLSNEKAYVTVPWTDTTYLFDGEYNANTNKAATKQTVTNAINELNVSNISGFGKGKTLLALSETNGKISASFQDIEISGEKITSGTLNFSRLPTMYWANVAISNTSATNKSPIFGSVIIASKANLYQNSDNILVLGDISTGSNIAYYVFNSEHFRPASIQTGELDLGSSQYKWKNLYLTGNITAANTILTGSLNVTGATTLSDNVTVGGQLTSNSLTVNGNSSFNNQVNFNNQIPTALTAENGDNSTKLATTAFVTNAVTSLSGPMRFIGTLGTEGTVTSIDAAAASNKGYAYKVITTATYQGISAKEGDLLVSNGQSWILIPSGDEPSGTVTNIKLKAGNGILIDSDAAITTSGTRTISHANTSSVSNMTTGGRTYINSIEFDSFGHVTGISTGTESETISSSWATATATGPILSVTVNNVNTTATIPVASDTQSGVITTISQTIAGNKTFKNHVYFANGTDYYISSAGNAKFNGLTLGNALSVGNGGTGATSFTSGQVLIGNGTNAITTKAIEPSVNLTAGNSTDAPKLKITVLEQTSTAVELTKASTNTYGVTKLSSATNSTATDIAATPAAVKAAYDAATTAATNSAYAGSIETTSAAKYNTEPEVKSIKITDNTSANTSATNGVVLQYDATLKVLNFVFA